MKAEHFKSCMKKLNVNLKKERQEKRSIEDVMRLKWALDAVLDELSEEDRNRLEEVIQTQGIQMLQAQNPKSETHPQQQENTNSA